MVLLSKLLPLAGGNLRSIIKNGEIFTIQTVKINNTNFINVFDKHFNEVLSKTYQIKRQGNNITKKSSIVRQDPFYSIANGEYTTTIRNYDKDKNLVSVVKQEFDKTESLKKQTLVDDIFKKETTYMLDGTPDQCEFWIHKKMEWAKQEPLQTFHRIDDFYTDTHLYPYANKKS